MSIPTKSTDFAIVTTANEGYFSPLLELITSLAPLCKSPSICSISVCRRSTEG